MERRMRACILSILLLTTGYVWSQAAAEGALLNSGASGAAAGAGRALSGSLNQAFGNASGQVQHASGSQMIVVPAGQRRTGMRSTPATKMTPTVRGAYVKRGA